MQGVGQGGAAHARVEEAGLSESESEKSGIGRGKLGRRRCSGKREGLG